jgi:hypothetical protein
MRDANGPEPEVDGHAGLEIRGTISEPIRDVRDVTLRLWADGNHQIGPNRPAYIGYITHTRPEVGVIAGFPRADFDYIWVARVIRTVAARVHVVYEAALRLSVTDLSVVLERARGVAQAT